MMAAPAHKQQPSASLSDAGLTVVPPDLVPDESTDDVAIVPIIRTQRLELVCGKTGHTVAVDFDAEAGLHFVVRDQHDNELQRLEFVDGVLTERPK